MVLLMNLWFRLQSQFWRLEVVHKEIERLLLNCYSILALLSLAMVTTADWKLQDDKKQFRSFHEENKYCTLVYCRLELYLGCAYHPWNCNWLNCRNSALVFVHSQQQFFPNWQIMTGARTPVFICWQFVYDVMIVSHRCLYNARNRIKSRQPKYKEFHDSQKSVSDSNSFIQLLTKIDRTIDKDAASMKNMMVVVGPVMWK